MPNPNLLTLASIYLNYPASLSSFMNWLETVSVQLRGGPVFQCASVIKKSKKSPLDYLPARASNYLGRVVGTYHISTGIGAISR